MSEQWKWPGARWWKCDLHVHTGESPCYRDRDSYRASEWVEKARRAGLDAVAVTDHNTGAGIAAIQEAAASDGRPLVVFPGVELSVDPGVHLLVLFDPPNNSDAVAGLLGASGIPEQLWGSDKAHSNLSVPGAIRLAGERGGIVIGAHVDADKGLLKEYSRSVPLQNILTSDSLAAVEITLPESQHHELLGNRTEGYRRRLGPLAQVTFSDAHQVEHIGRRFTWIKMTEPNREGLLLALQDGPLSVRNLWSVASAEPNTHADLCIEEIEVCDAKYMGREEAFRVRFNPWLNAIIGGRGTGKSTLVELLRTALRRQDELPPRLAADFEKYWSVSSGRDDQGLLTDEARIAVIYRKQGARFRIQWSPGGDVESISEEDAEGDWRRAEGEVRQRFPVRIYSQKQIFELAREPLALLAIVDEAPEVGYDEWRRQWDAEERRFLSLRARAREIAAGLEDEARLRGELDDVQRRLVTFEREDHAEVLRGYQRRMRQRRTVEAWEQAWGAAAGRLREVAQEIAPEALDSSAFSQRDSNDAELLALAQATGDDLRGVVQRVEQLGDAIDQVTQRWAQTKASSSWSKAVQRAVASYEALSETLQQEGAGDPGAYGQLVQERQLLEQRLAALAARRSSLEEMEAQAAETHERLRALRRELTHRRRQFLDQVLAESPYVRISVEPFGARAIAEAELRRILGREDGSFPRDLGRDEGCMGALYPPEGGDDAEGREGRLVGVKERLRRIADGRHRADEVRDARFASHLARLPPESFDRLELWFPEDSLDVRYSPSGDGGSFRSLQEGSPGQRTAALLAFLLSYGDEPIVLDQPEDDLDNHLIYELIVTQLRQIKSRRQVIVVTHNPNIVVNGDAELVVALDARGGQTRTISSGSLQERGVRAEICRVMEGGEEAFELRFRRIFPGGADAG